MTSAPFDDRDGWIWFDGEMVPWRDARLHVMSHGLHYAGSVFEGERAYGGRIFKLREHSRRLVKSAHELGFEIPFGVDELDRASVATLAHNDLEDGYIRPIAWRGGEMMGVSAQRCRVHVAIAAWPWGAYYDDLSLEVSSWRRPAPATAPVHAKCSSLYAIATLARHAAESRGYADAIMLDHEGWVAEATGANLFAVIEGAIHTPIADRFLDGITRRTVIALAEERGIQVVQRRIAPDELRRADEVFATGTAAEITPVNMIEQTVYRRGPITRQLIDDYATLTRVGGDSAGRAKPPARQLQLDLQPCTANERDPL